MRGRLKEQGTLRTGGGLYNQPLARNRRCLATRTIAEASPTAQKSKSTLQKNSAKTLLAPCHRFVSLESEGNIQVTPLDPRDKETPFFLALI